MMTISKFQHATTSPIYYRFQVLSKDVVKTKQLLVGASGTEEPVQLRSSQKKQGKTKAQWGSEYDPIKYQKHFKYNF